MYLLNIMLSNYYNLLLLVLVSAVFTSVIVVFSYFLAVENPDSEKLSTYECGYEAYENSRHIFNVRFFLVAILFIIFDIEMVFLIPWCVSVADFNLLSFWSIIDFVFELGVGFFYVWYSNSLSWQ